MFKSKLSQNLVRAIHILCCVSHNYSLFCIQAPKALLKILKKIEGPLYFLLFPNCFTPILKNLLIIHNNHFLAFILITTVSETKVMEKIVKIRKISQNLEKLMMTETRKISCYLALHNVLDLKIIYSETFYTLSCFISY